MVDTTDIEKKSLEAHVELCAERYRMLELKVETVEKEISEVKSMVTEVHSIVRKMAEWSHKRHEVSGFCCQGHLVVAIHSVKNG